MSAIFETTILGSSAATPTSVRHTSAQLLKYHNLYFLIDCAEGCQMQLRRLKKPLMKISHIFISHLHGDHYLGLPGLLFSCICWEGKRNCMCIPLPDWKRSSTCNTKLPA